MNQLIPSSVRPADPPSARTSGSVDWGQIFFACFFVLIVAGLLVLGARILADEGTVAGAVSAALGAALVPFVASPLEWFVHRFVYHDDVVRPLQAIHRVHVAHHYAYFPTWRYVTNGPARRLSIRRRSDVHLSVVRNAGVRLAHFAWYVLIGVSAIWLPAWFLTTNPWFLAGIVASSIVVSNLFIVVHDTIHRPGSHRFVEAQPWFAFLDRHHYVHHVDLDANLNFLLPLADWMFGTLRTRLTAEELAEHGPLHIAKKRPIGQGERARASLQVPS